ncbi:clathrin light chain isoform X9 [Anopheles stephensi]|uniref:clathrin light chain isoform X9 n=1 Tax=Anopheles stephensi TaxID=30069 RepID=UPI001658800A|nr:clathrin light chain isoform X9 [Anopheles stephensi]
MNAFGDNFEQSEVDPAAEFLAREQNALAGLEDEIPPVSGAATSATNGSVNGDPVPKAVPKQVTEEPEKIRKWREDQKARLEEKDREEERKKDELREQARKELEDWYKHHEETISKTKAANRESAKNAEKQFVAETDEIEPGTEWERIAKLCDFNPKTNKSSKDISRMRSIILQLKQNPLQATKKV